MINIIKRSDKSNYVNGFSVYGITFDGASSWSFCNNFTRNAVIFVVGNNSSSHTDNGTTNFLVLTKGPTDDINGIFGVVEKRFSITFSKVKAKFCLSLHYNSDYSYLFVIGKK